MFLDTATMKIDRSEFELVPEDKGLLLLFVTDKPNYTFPAGGMKKDTYFTRSLVENGISLPARYIMEWNEEADAWVGVLQGERKTDALSATLKRSYAPRKKTNE